MVFLMGSGLGHAQACYRNPGRIQGDFQNRISHDGEGERNGYATVAPADAATRNAPPDSSLRRVYGAVAFPVAPYRLTPSQHARETIAENPPEIFRRRSRHPQVPQLEPDRMKLAGRRRNRRNPALRGRPPGVLPPEDPGRLRARQNRPFRARRPGPEPVRLGYGQMPPPQVGAVWQTLQKPP